MDEVLSRALDAVDSEISALRRHFLNVRTAQDYRNVGLDWVAVTEALSRLVGITPARSGCTIAGTVRGHTNRSCANVAGRWRTSETRSSKPSAGRC